MRAPQTCTDCPRPFATRKKIHPHLAHTPSFRWPDAALMSVLEFLASLYEHPKTSQPNEVSFPTNFQKRCYCQDSRSEDGCFKGLRADWLQNAVSGSPIIWMGSNVICNMSNEDFKCQDLLRAASEIPKRHGLEGWLMSIHAGTLKHATLYTRLSSVALCNRHFELPRVRSWLDRFTQSHPHVICIVI